MIGFLGLGHMGEPMAVRLAEAGTDLLVWSRSDTKHDVVRRAGAQVAASAAEVFERSEVVLCMLANGEATDSVLGRSASGFGVPVQGQVVVNMGTVSPEYSRSLGEDLAAHGATFVEAPVSGSRGPATTGELVAMLAGEPAALDRVEALVEPLTAAVFRCGPVPRAIETKLAANTFLIGMVTALAESVHFAQGRGLDVDLLRQVLDAGPMASPFSRGKLAKVAEHDLTAQAAVADVLYNNRLILDAAATRALPMPLLEVCGALLASTVDLGHGGLDVIGVIEGIRAAAPPRP